MNKPTVSAMLLRWTGSLLSLALFLFLVTSLEWNQFLTQIHQLTLESIALAVLFYFLSQIFNTLRWCSLLWTHGVAITFWQALQITWSGIFASNFLPSTVGGDGLRIIAVYPYTRSKTVAVGSVVLDRILNMAAMFCLLPLPLLTFGEKWPALAISLLPFRGRVLLERYFPKILAALREWVDHPQAFLWAFLVAWPSNLTAMFSTWLIARQLEMQVTFWQVAAVQTVTYFLAVLPISVNGYGIREVSYSALFVLLGASLEQASLLALITRFLIVLVTLPGALWISRVTTQVIEPPA